MNRILAGPKWALAAALLICGLAMPAAAQERPATAFQLTPYVWASGSGGTFRPFAGGPELEIDNSFSDILENLDAAFFLTGYVRADRFVLVADFSYASLTRAGQIPALGGLPAEGRLRQTSFTLASGYRVVDQPSATLDLLLGARAWWIRANVDVAGAVQRSPRLDFVDPIVAIRGNVALAPRWSAIGYADIGGFGAGSESTFQVVGTVNYQLSDRFFLSGGYRHLEVDYRSGGSRVDMRMSGPLLGATFRF
jgi:hypothetical protein